MNERLIRRTFYCFGLHSVRINLFFFILSAISLSCYSQTAERDIILVNVDTLNRKGIADVINIINRFAPKVIAIDLQFSNDRNEDYDRSLISALNGCKNLVMVSVIEDYHAEDFVHTKGFIPGCLPKFTANAKTGFANTILERDELQTLKKFSIAENVCGKIEYHFAIRTAMEFDSLKAMKFVKGHYRIIHVNYRNGERRFAAFSSSEVLGQKIKREDVEGKIAMIGFLGPGDEDKFFTPLNTDPEERDMYGLEYLANIVAQVLESK